MRAYMDPMKHKQIAAIRQEEALGGDQPALEGYDRSKESEKENEYENL